MSAITLSFTSTSFTLKRRTRNTRTGAYFVMLEGKILKEYATYESALKHYRHTPNSTILPRASALSFYAEQLSTTR
jgi:hypothetical protein